MFVPRAGEYNNGGVGAGVGMPVPNVLPSIAPRGGPAQGYGSPMMPPPPPQASSSQVRSIAQLEKRVQLGERANKALLEETARLQADLKQAIELHRNEFERDRQERGALSRTLRNQTHVNQRLNGDLQTIDAKGTNQSQALVQTIASTRNLEGAVVELQRQGAVGQRTMEATAARLQQLEKTLEQRLAGDEAAIQQQASILELLSKETREAKNRAASLEQGLQGVAQTATQQSQQLQQELRGVAEQLGQAVTEIQRVSGEAGAGIARHDADVQRLAADLGGLRQSLDQVATQSAEWNNHLGADIQLLTQRHKDVAAAADGRHDQTLGRLHELQGTQDQDRSRLSDVVKKGLEVQTLKQADLETRVNTDIRVQFQEMVKMVQQDRGARTDFEGECRASIENRSRALSTDLAAAQSMLATAVSKIQLDYRNSVARLHESIQLVERTMDASRNELAQVLDAEIRTRQKQETKTAGVLTGYNEAIAAQRGSLEQQLQDLTALTTRITEETRSLAKKEVLGIKDQHARLMADTETRFSMTTVQLARLEQASSQVTSAITGQIELERKHTDSSVATLQERILAQLKLIEARVESLPPQVEQTHQRIETVRTEMGSRFTTEGTERGRELDLVRIALARKVDTELLDRSTEGLRQRVERGETRTADIVNQISEIDRELTGTKVMLGTTLKAEQAQRSEGDEELRQALARQADASMRAVRDLSNQMQQMEGSMYSPPASHMASPEPPAGQGRQQRQRQQDGEGESEGEGDSPDPNDSTMNSSMYASQPLAAIEESDAYTEDDTDTSDNEGEVYRPGAESTDNEGEVYRPGAESTDNEGEAYRPGAESTDNEGEVYRPGAESTGGGGGGDGGDGDNQSMVSNATLDSRATLQTDNDTSDAYTEDESDTDSHEPQALGALARGGDPADMPLDQHGARESSDEDEDDDEEDDDDRGRDSDSETDAGRESESPGRNSRGSKSSGKEQGGRTSATPASGAGAGPSPGGNDSVDSTSTRDETPKPTGASPTGGRLSVNEVTEAADSGSDADTEDGEDGEDGPPQFLNTRN